MINPDNVPVQRNDRAQAARETSDLKTRKTPNARKEFKEILDDKQEEDQTVSGREGKEEQDNSLMSLFSRPPKKETIRGDLRSELDQKMLLEEGASLSSLLPTKSEVKPKKPLKENASFASGTSLEKSTDSEEEMKMDLLTRKGQPNSEYETNQPDISFLNPGQNPVNPINLNTSQKVEQTVSIGSPIEIAVSELTDKLMIVQTKGQTDMVVQLNAPGTFQGTIVVISEFDSAKGQLNLAFENLKNEAKLLLDSVSNRESLLTALSEKGYIVQQFTTTTIIEHTPIATDETRGEREREQNKERENPKEKERNG
ncbi:MAG TPA: hypothetical protein PLC42_03295 [Parachlamydiaceae bacterium]|nr:hypothetical protein [Parachlamydiaceae bacterium]